MWRKTMIALCAAASVLALTPNMALARGGGGGGGGGGHGGGGGGGFGGGHAGGFGGHAGGFGGGGFGGHAGGFGGGGFAARGGGFAGRGGFAGAPTNSFARAAPNGGVATGAVQGNRFAGGQFGRGFDHDHGFHHGFHHGRHFFGGGFFYGPDIGYDYWDYPDYAYDDSYYDNGGCYVMQRRIHTRYGWRIRPVQVCG